MLSQALMGAPLYCYTSQVGPRFGDSRSLVECTNGAITSVLRLISTSDWYPHPYETYIKWFSHWYVVSRAYACTLIPLHQPGWPQICEVRVTCGVTMMSLRHGWGWFPPQTPSYIPIMHTKCLSDWYAVSRACWYTLIPLHWPSWPQIWKFRFTWGVKMMP